MIADEIVIKYIGGATALLEAGGLRLLTDPTFDPKDSKYDTGLYVLHKMTNPSVEVNTIGKIDIVLLSHDHHFDNLDNSGRQLLSSVDKILTTPVGAERLGSKATGLKNWETVEIPAKDGRILEITGTPCRHGPIDGDRGPVTGFVLNFKGETKGAVYITGDTVWYPGVEEVAKRFDIKRVICFMGAAVVKNVGAAHLTMTVEESIRLAKVFDKATIIPLHFEGWEHFTEGYEEIVKKYEEAGLMDRLQWAGATE
ncbi:MAG: MBL fold metallo-hydrolase [Bacteroidota bacterium]|nr:MBL fold metallo-hydrolase [Bacteroidota bacterium]